MMSAGPPGGKGMTRRTGFDGYDCANAEPATQSAASSALETEDALGIAVEDLLHHFVLIAELLPLPEDPLIRHARVVAAEHDLVLQPAADVDLEVAGKILRRPARHFP